MRAKTGKPRPPTAAKPASGPRPVTKPWTLLVYMVTDSADGPSRAARKLDQTATEDAVQMWKAFQPHRDRLHVAIQADLKTTPGTYRWILGQSEAFTRESVATSRRALNDFFKWGRRECPAKRYAVMFWGHSEGPMGLFSDALPEGSTDGEELSLKELSAGLRHMSRKGLNGKPIEVVLFKNCFQAILETGFEIRDSVRFVIASQALIPSVGWPYDKLFASLIKEPTETIVHRLLRGLGRFYADEKNRNHHPVVPFSLLDVRALEEVAAPMKALVRALVKAKDMSDQIDAACKRAWLRNDAAGTELPTSEAQLASRLAPGDVLLVDVRTLCSELMRLNLPGLAGLARALGKKIDRVVVGIQPKSGAFRGVSAYYVPPPAPKQRKSNVGLLLDQSEYEDLECSRKTHWDRIALINES
ncbi:MAG: clostripain-related cysteine peptidase [Acidobacteriota bacterium]